MSGLDKQALDRYITGDWGERSVGRDILLSDEDWSALQKSRMEQIGNAPLGAVAHAINALPDYVAWQLADDRDTYGDQAGWWLVVSPDYEEELSKPFATREG